MIVVGEMRGDERVGVDKIDEKKQMKTCLSKQVNLIAHLFPRQDVKVVTKMRTYAAVVRVARVVAQSMITHCNVRGNKQLRLNIDER